MLGVKSGDILMLLHIVDEIIVIMHILKDPKQNGTAPKKKSVQSSICGSLPN